MLIKPCLLERLIFLLSILLIPINTEGTHRASASTITTILAFSTWPNSSTLVLNSTLKLTALALLYLSSTLKDATCAQVSIFGHQSIAYLKLILLIPQHPVKHATPADGPHKLLILLPQLLILLFEVVAKHMKLTVLAKQAD